MEILDTTQTSKKPRRKHTQKETYPEGNIPRRKHTQKETYPEGNIPRRKHTQKETYPESVPFVGKEKFQNKNF